MVWQVHVYGGIFVETYLSHSVFVYGVAPKMGTKIIVTTAVKW